MPLYFSRDLPLTVASLPILSKAYYAKVDFTKTTLTPPVGSGPYKIASFKPGEYVAYGLRDDYWGKDLAIAKGLWNFDTVRFDYYRDANAAFEAFKSGLADGEEVIYALLPLFHAYGLTLCLTFAMSIGATLVLFPRFDAQQALEAGCAPRVVLAAAGTSAASSGWRKALVAGLSSSMMLTRYAERQTEVLLAQFCAQNTLAALRLRARVPAGKVSVWAIGLGIGRST